MPTSDELSKQQRLTAAINTQLGLINKQLEKELENRIVLGQQAKGEAVDREAARRQAQSSSSSALSDQQNINSAVGEEISLRERSNLSTADQSITMKGYLADLEDAATKGAGVFDSAGKMLNEFVPAQLMENLGKLQTLMGGFSGPDGVVDAMTGEFVGTNKQVNSFAKAIDGAYEGLYASKGAFADAFGALPTRALGDLNTVMAEFGKLLSGGDGMVNGLKLSKAVTGDMILEFRALQKAMNLSTDEMQEFIHRGISATGKANLDMVREAAVYSKRLAGITGDSAKMISQNITKIIGDTEHFGNVTVAEAARISVTLRQLGLGYGELGTMVGKYLSFEGAAESVSKLTTVFGVQMDAMDMMMLANEDQEQFLHRFRDQFLMTAKSVDDMTLAEKRLIKEAAGLSDIQAVERLLDPDAALTDIATLTSGTEQGVGETSEIMAMLKDDIIDLHDVTAYSSTAMADNINEKMRLPLRKMAIETEQNAVKIARSFEKAIPEKTGEAIKYFGEGIKDFLDIDESHLEKLGEILKDFASGTKDFASEVKDSDIGELVGDSIDKVAGPGKAASMSSGIKSAMMTMVTEWGKAVDLMIEKLGPLLAGSESDVGKSFRVGWMLATNNTVKEFSAVFTGQEGLAAITQKEGKKAADIQLKMFDSNIDAARHMLEKMQTDKGEYLSIATKKQKQEFAKQFELSKEQMASLNIETREKLLKDTENNWQAAFEATADVIDKKGAAAFKKISDINKEELDTQLKDFTSVYSSMAREMGVQGIEYRKLSDEQKAYYAHHFKLGEDWESELKSIFDSDAYKTGAKRTAQGDMLTDIIEDMRAAGRTGADVNNELAGFIKQKYKMNRKQFQSLLEADPEADIGSLVADSLRTREQKLAAAKTAKEGTSAKERDSNTSGITRAEEKLLKANIKEQKETRQQLAKNTAVLSQIKAAIEGKEFTAGDVTVNLSGQDITNAVVANPVANAGPGNGSRIQLKTGG